VERFLRFTDRDPGEVIGIFPPANRQATVWNVAVNGVMAGCRPEYMPVLLAVVEAVADPQYKVEDAGSTPGWESLIVLSGPDRASAGVSRRPGRDARGQAGEHQRRPLPAPVPAQYRRLSARAGRRDKGSIAQSFLVVLSENEDAVATSAGKPYSVDRGFKPGENVVTVQSVVAVSAPTYTGTEKATEHMEIIADVIGERACGYWTAIGMVYSNWHPLMCSAPSIAKVFAQDGWTKDDIRRYLYERVKMPASRAERYAYHCGQTGFRVTDHVKQGLLPPAYHESDDPDRLIPVFQRAEWIGIVVAGDWGRNQSKGYVCNHVQGVPTSRRIVLPRNWDALLEEGRATT
jgi:hypothetical protein